MLAQRVSFQRLRLPDQRHLGRYIGVLAPGLEDRQIDGDLQRTILRS